MEKTMPIYTNQADFESHEDELNQLEHYTALKKEKDELEYKNYLIKIEDFIKPVSASTAADICLVENNTLNKYIVDGNSYSVNVFPSEQYTPIGVVVVPGSHTDDGTARIISLASMDYNNPDNGNTNGHIGMCWGGEDYKISTLKGCGYSPIIIRDTGTTFPEIQEIVEWTSFNCYIPSDYYFDTKYEGATNPYDTATCWGSAASYDWGCPSPYLNDGSKNELYSQVYDNGSGIGNIVEEMDGRVNTKAILDVDNSNSTDWQTAETITNRGRTETIHPAAQCCWRYHTVGTNQGDWYLPAGGELGYLLARWKAINASIQKVISSGFQALPVVSQLWSSTEYSKGYAIELNFFTTYCLLSYSDKFNAKFFVRAFLAV